ncbi:MAG: hypothetical protein M3T49_06810 [Candidatus Eremiobacteraeota bacterium]|nr:hypothetical protein [Candidatus Eremiobacteraeota bacterium]
MRHLDGGLMRRLMDEPSDVALTARRHLEECQRCSAAYGAIERNADAARTALGTLAAQSSDFATARVGVPPGAVAAGYLGGTSASSSERAPGRLDRWVKPVGGLAAATVLVLALALTPLGTLAQSFLTIFQPQHFVGIAVSPQDMRDLQTFTALENYGTMRELARPRDEAVPDALTAARVSRLELRLPAVLSPDVPKDAHYRVMTQGSALFSFSAAEARVSALRGHRPLRPMPARLDGATLQLVLGPAVVISYGERNGDANTRGNHSSNGEAIMPGLVIAQGLIPRLGSTGVTVRDIVAYLTAQPGVPARLARQIEAIRDPSTTLPIPIPIDRASAMQVPVQGVAGLAIGDNTRVGSGVMWQNNGMVYAVAGRLPLAEILAIADSLR